MRSAVSVLIALAAACVPPRHSGNAGPARVLLGESVHVRSGAPDPLLGSSVYSARDLFDAALSRHQQGEHGLARTLWARLVREFPADPLAVLARYDGAVAAEAMGDQEGAASLWLDYALAIDTTEPAGAAEARLDAARNVFAADREAELAAAPGGRIGSGAGLLAARVPLEEALVSGLLDEDERWEARALAARVSARLGDFDAALDKLDDVSRDVRRAAARDGARYGESSAMAWFHAGAVFRERAAALPLRSVDDLEVAKAWLDGKAADLLEARRCWKRVLQHRLPAWSGPASAMLARINEEFRVALLRADVPSGLDEESRAIYVDLLEQNTRAFLEKALDDYRWLVRDAPDLGIEEPFRGALAGELARIEEALLEFEDAPR
jgi:hypothetical protein